MPNTSSLQDDLSSRLEQLAKLHEAMWPVAVKQFEFEQSEYLKSSPRSRVRLLVSTPDKSLR